MFVKRSSPAERPRSASPLWVRGALLGLVLAGLLLAPVLPVVAGDDDDDDGILYVRDDRAYLGVTIEEAWDDDDGGARITRIIDGSPADDAGLEKGDVIVEFDGRTIRGPRALSKAIERADAGERIEIRVKRDGRVRTFDAELVARGQMNRSYTFSGGQNSQEWAERMEAFGEKWADWGERFGEEWAEKFSDEDFAEQMEELGLEMGELGEELADVRVFGHGQSLVYDDGVAVICEDGDCETISSGSRPKLGVYLVETTEELRQHLGGGDDEGVLVSRVVEDSPAEEAGVQVGDLILSLDGSSVKSSRELRRALRDLAGETVDLEISRDGRVRRMSVSFPEAKSRGRGPRASLLLRERGDRVARLEAERLVRDQEAALRDARAEQRLALRRQVRDVNRAAVEQQAALRLDAERLRREVELQTEQVREESFRELAERRAVAELAARETELALREQRRALEETVREAELEAARLQIDRQREQRALQRELRRRERDQREEPETGVYRPL